MVKDHIIRTMNNTEVYIVMVFVKDAEEFKRQYTNIKDWDGKTPLYFNGSYYDSLSPKVTRAKLYSKDKYAREAVERMTYNFRGLLKVISHFKIQKIKVEHKVEFEDIIKFKDEYRRLGLGSKGTTFSYPYHYF